MASGEGIPSVKITKKIEGANFGLPVAGCQLPVTSCRSSVQAFFWFGEYDPILRVLLTSEKAFA
jgi:hypothetical protein